MLEQMFLKEMRHFGQSTMDFGASFAHNNFALLGIRERGVP